MEPKIQAGTAKPLKFVIVDGEIPDPYDPATEQPGPIADSIFEENSTLTKQLNFSS